MLAPTSEYVGRLSMNIQNHKRQVGDLWTYKVVSTDCGHFLG
nr:MAG TPA: Kinase associated domain 1 [Caudoviricetes sp.]